MHISAPAIQRRSLQACYDSHIFLATKVEQRRRSLDFYEAHSQSKPRIHCSLARPLTGDVALTLQCFTELQFVTGG